MRVRLPNALAALVRVRRLCPPATEAVLRLRGLELVGLILGGLAQHAAGAGAGAPESVRTAASRASVAVRRLAPRAAAAMRVRLPNALAALVRVRRLCPPATEAVLRLRGLELVGLILGGLGQRAARAGAKAPESIRTAASRASVAVLRLAPRAAAAMRVRLAYALAALVRVRRLCPPAAEAVLARGGLASAETWRCGGRRQDAQGKQSSPHQVE